MGFRKSINVWIFCQTKDCFVFVFFLEKEVVEAGEIM